MKIIVIALGVTILVLFGILLFVPAPQRAMAPTSNASSTGTGVPQTVMSPDGHVAVSAPLAGESVVSPFTVVGTVTGDGWFFEASFPVKVVDADGTVLGGGQARATEDWMTTSTVPFTANITFAKPHSATGTIVFSKDNPSGLPQNAESFSVPVRFGTAASATGVVRGIVSLGPTCPVERIPPDPQCAPRPFVGVIGVSRNIENPVAFETAQTDASGSFRFVLSPGEYDIFHANAASALPRCEEKIVTVVAGQTADIAISCDTGIR